MWQWYTCISHGILLLAFTILELSTNKWQGLFSEQIVGPVCLFDSVIEHLTIAENAIDKKKKLNFTKTLHCCWTHR